MFVPVYTHTRVKSLELKKKNFLPQLKPKTHKPYQCYGIFLSTRRIDDWYDW